MFGVRRRVVRHIIVQIQQTQQRSQKALGLPGRQTKHHAYRDGRLDRVIRVLALTTRLPALQPGRIPVRELAIGECNPDLRLARLRKPASYLRQFRTR